MQLLVEFGGDENKFPNCRLRLVRPPADRRRRGDLARHLPALRAFPGRQPEDEPTLQRDAARGETPGLRRAC